jgi:hypothetical protein
MDLHDELIAAEKLIKEQKESIKAELIHHFKTTQQQSARFPGIGTIALKSKTTVAVGDIEKVCTFMFEKMAEAYDNGQPLTNHLVLHKRASQGEMLEWAQKELKNQNLPETPENFSNILNTVGFLYLAETDLQLTRKE